MSGFLSRLGGSSSRRSSVSDDPNQPTTSEIKTSPAPGCVPKKRPGYTPDQQQNIEELREYAFGLLLPESDPYHPWEKRFLSDPGCIPRYCRAAKWRMDNAKERIKGTIDWRREYKPDLIKPDDVKIEAETGKIIINGFDVDARPIIYMRPGRENTQKSPRQIQHLIFHLERAIDMAPPGVDTVTIVVDYASATSQSNPSISTARQVLNILQNHYVERMGKAIVVNMPWWVNAFFQGIQPFMDPVTKEKIRFNPNMPEIVPKEQLDLEFGGENNYKFDHTIYWNTLVKECHLAPDGGRLDEQGKSTIPPLGNGARAAAGSSSASGAIADKSSSSGQSAVADLERKSNAHDAALGVGAVGIAGAGAHSLNGDVDGHQERDLETKMSNLRTSAVKDEERSGRTSIDSVEALKTAPGPPAGPIVFDHAPTEAEKQQAQELLQNHGVSS